MEALNKYIFFIFKYRKSKSIISTSKFMPRNLILIKDQPQFSELKFLLAKNGR